MQPGPPNSDVVINSLPSTVMWWLIEGHGLSQRWPNSATNLPISWNLRAAKSRFSFGSFSGNASRKFI